MLLCYTIFNHVFQLVKTESPDCQTSESVACLIFKAIPMITIYVGTCKFQIAQ